MSFPIIRFAIYGDDSCFEPQIPKGVVYATGHRGASLPTLKSAMIRWKSRGGVECVRLHHDQS